MKHPATLILFVICIFWLDQNIALGQWSQLNLSESKFQVFAAAAGSKVLFGGGVIGGLVSTPHKVEIYDVENEEWSYFEHAAGHHGAGVTATEDKIFIGGGLDFVNGQGTNFDEVDIYDVSNDSWDSTHLSIARNSLSAAAAGGKVLFAGGNDQTRALSQFNDFDVVDIYDQATGTWDTAYLSQSRYGMFKAAVGTKILFAGGARNSDTEASAVVDIYDVATDTWSTAALSVARAAGGSATVGKYVIFAGGINTEGSSDAVDIWDSEEDTWTTANLSLARGFLTAGSIGNKAFFAGGGGVDLANAFLNSSTSRVDIFDASTGEWSTAEMPTSRTAVYGTVSCDQLFIPGGWTPETGFMQRSIDVYTEADFQCITSRASELSLSSQIRLSPNPVYGELNIENLPQNLEYLEILDQYGRTRLILQGKTPSRADVSGLSRGWYCLRLSTPQGAISLPFIKM